MLDPGELIERAEQENGEVVAERSRDVELEQGHYGGCNVLILHLFVRRRTPFVVKDCQSGKQVMLVDRFLLGLNTLAFLDELRRFEEDGLFVVR